MPNIFITILFMQLAFLAAGFAADEEKQHENTGPLISFVQNLKSIKILEQNFHTLKDIAGIVIVGSSGSGKTTLVNEIIAKCPGVFAPKRFITRPSRLNDDDGENIHVTQEDFDARVKTGEIVLAWKRVMDAGREEWYGFENTKHVLPIYSANNAFLASGVAAGRNYLIIAIEASLALRKERLLERSPDFSAAEMANRLKDPYQDEMQQAHLVVKNDRNFEKISKFDLTTLIKSLQIIKNGWGQITDIGHHELEYHTRLFDVMTHQVEFSDGQQKKFQYVRRSPGVRVILKQDNKILITAEWRTEIFGWDFRLPGGKIFETSKDYGEFLEKFGKIALLERGQETALAEIQEECGLALEKENIKYFATSVCGATVDWDLFYYTADFTKQVYIFDNKSPEGERTLSLWIDVDDVLKLCLNNSIHEDRSAAVLMRFILNSPKLEK